MATATPRYLVVTSGGAASLQSQSPARLQSISVVRKFILGDISHCHPGNPGVAEKHRLTKKAYRRAGCNVFKSATADVEELMAEDLRPEMPSGSRPTPSNLIRCCNYQRQKHRPPEPTDLQFTIIEDYMPDDFFKADIKVDEDVRHLTFAIPTSCPF